MERSMDIGIILKTMLKRFEELTGLRRFKPEKKIDFSWIIEGARKLFNFILNGNSNKKKNTFRNTGRKSRDT